MTQEQAQKIAEEHIKDFPTRDTVLFCGIMRNKFLFSYRRSDATGGHIGKSLLATISEHGKWRLLENDKEILEATISSCEYLNKTT